VPNVYYIRSRVADFSRATNGSFGSNLAAAGHFEERLLSVRVSDAGLA